MHSHVIAQSRTPMQHQRRGSGHRALQCHAGWGRGLAPARPTSSQPPWWKPGAQVVDLRDWDPWRFCLWRRRFAARDDWLCASRCIVCLSFQVHDVDVRVFSYHFPSDIFELVLIDRFCSRSQSGVRYFMTWVGASSQTHEPRCKRGRNLYVSVCRTWKYSWCIY